MKTIPAFMYRSLRALSLSLFLVSCVTINIYFPAAAAEKAADRIIQDVWGEQPEGDMPEQAPETEIPETGALQTEQARHTLAAGLLQFFIASAHAQGTDINIATPAIDKLRASMRLRHAALEPHYNSGTIGLTGDALISERNVSAVPLRERNVVKQLIADENRDRNALYREIAVANNKPQGEPDIRAAFAKQWVANARPGWWYRDSGGTWQQK